METPKMHRKQFEDMLGEHAKQKENLEKKQAEEIVTAKSVAEEEAYADTERLEKLRKEMENIMGTKEESAKTEKNETSFESLKKDWQDFYKETFGIESDFSKIKIPEKQEGFERLIIVEKDMTAQKVFDKCKELFPAVNNIKNLDAITPSDSKVDQAYAIWVRETIETDEKLKNIGANDIAEKNITTEKLNERLLYEIKYFKQTGKYLDAGGNPTFCTGSRDSGGWDPITRWNDGKLYLSMCIPISRYRANRNRKVS